MICCKWLKTSLENMNQNGITIVPRERFGGRFFVVRFRWVDPHIWEGLSSQLPQMTPFATAGEKAIIHCPGCGANLADWIQAYPADYESLLAKVID
jgi:hypothetical protein